MKNVKALSIAALAALSLISFGSFAESISVTSSTLDGAESKIAAQAQAAIDALNGHELDGRTVRVNESQPKPREEREGGFGGGRGGRGGFGGGRGGFGGGRGGFRGGDRGPRRETRW